MVELKQRHWTLALISVGWMLIFIGRLTGPTLLVQIENSLNITDPQAGIALSGMWFLYGVMQYPGGAISDSIGRKKVLLISIGGFALSSIFVGLSVNYIMLILTFSFMGFAAGLFPSPSLTMLSELFKDKKGKALGIRSGVGSLSGLVPMGLPILVLFIGWRNIFFLWCGLGLLVAYLFYILVEESLKSPVKRPIKDQMVMGFRSLMEGKTAFMFFINLMISFSWIGMISWFPTYIQKAKGMSPEIAGILFSIVLLGGFILKPLLGHLSDKVNKIWIMLFLTVTAAGSLYLLTIMHTFYALVIISFLFAQTGAFYPVRTSYLMDMWHSKEAGTKLGIFRSGVILLGSPISALIGWSKVNYGFDFAILLVVAALLLASVLLTIKVIMNGYRPGEQC